MASKQPQYRLHKPSGRAILQWKPLEALIGKSEIYLDGTYGSRECVEHFARILRLLEEAKQPTAADNRRIKATPPTVADLVAAFCKAKGYGRTTGYGTTNIKQAIVSLNASHGWMDVVDFGPLALQEYRRTLITPDRAVSYINQLVGRVRKIFRWGVSQELVAAEQVAALMLVDGLRAGETAARVTEAIKPVAWEHVDAVLAKLPPMVAAMVQIHGLTGMRSGELTALKLSELDQSGDVWIYRKLKHKTSHRGKQKIICFGPRAQALMRPYMAHGGEFVFDPKIAEQERKTARAAARKTPLYGRAKTSKPSFQSTRNRYDSRTYYRTLHYAFVSLANERMGNGTGERERPPKGCDARAWLAERGVVFWHPHQLRHARATDTTDAFGVEAAQTQLGNTLQATQLYAERSLRLAIDIARQTG